MMRKKDAFTLVEMLVVIVVVVFVSCAGPNNWLGNRNSEEIICKSNLKGYGLSLIMYLDDNDQRFPDADRWLFGQDRGDTGKYCRWHNEALNLKHYPQDIGVF